MSRTQTIKATRISMYGLMALLVLGVIGGKVLDEQQQVFAVINLAVMSAFFMVYFVGSYLSEVLPFKGLGSRSLVTKKDNPKAYNLMLVTSFIMAVLFGTFIFIALLR